jgi:SNF2 family DNA or RNA helicase
LAEILLRLTKLAFVISHPTSTTARGDPVPLTQLRPLPSLTWATPKNRVTVELVKDAVQETGYCVLFAQTVGVLPVLAAQLIARGIPVHLTVKTSRAGKVQSVSPPERARIIHQFREQGGVLLASISAMAHGHDFSFVSRAVLHSLPFAYDHYAQAILRVHRLVSERPVVVHVLCATNTLDEYLLSLLQRKEAATRTVLASSLLRDATAITPEEWKRLWRQVVDAAERL